MPADLPADTRRESHPAWWIVHSTRQDDEVDMELARRMLEVVAAVPPGSVATYGDVAAAAGSPSPRLAGRVLSELADEDTPWFRILPASGRPAPHLADRQLALLAAEGVQALDGRISMRRYRQSPEDRH